MLYDSINKAYKVENNKTPLMKRFAAYRKQHNCSEEQLEQRFRTEVWNQLPQNQRRSFGNSFGAWREANHLDETSLKNEFTENYLNQLKPGEREELERQQKESKDRLQKNMEEELIRGFAKPRMTAKQFAELPRKVYDLFFEKGYDKNQNIDPLPETKVKLVTSPAELKRRQALSKKARLLAAKVYAEKSRSFWDASEQRFYTSTTLVRSVQAICQERGPDGQDLTIQNQKMVKTPMTEVPADKNDPNYTRLYATRQFEEQERRNLLDRQLKKAFALARELRRPMSDEEFMERFGNPEAFAMLGFMNEIQFSNHNKIVNGESRVLGFGVEPSPDVLKEWEEMSAEIAACGTMQNRLGLIANPLYAEFKDINSMVANYEWLYNNSYAGTPSLIEKCGGVNGLTDINTPGRLDAWRKNPNGEMHFDTFKHYSGISSFGCTKAMCFGVLASVKMPAVLKNRFGCEPNTLTFKDLDGNVLEGVFGLYEKLYDGKTCNVFDKNGQMLGALPGGSLDCWGALKEPDVPANYRVNTAEPEELESTMAALNAEVKNATHWFIKSSTEFTQFRKAMENLGKPGAFNDREAAKTAMRDVVNKANAYIKIKEDDDVEISENTQARLDIAHKIAAAFERTLTAQQQPVLEQNNAERIVVEEANHQNVQSFDSSKTEVPQKVVDNTLAK